MEQLPQLQARIGSLKELRDLIRALRALAASHIQDAQRALSGIRTYVEAIETAIGEGASLLPPGEIGSQGEGGSALVAVCSEHSFAGAFNREILDRCEAERRPEQSLVVVGQRGLMLARERELPVGEELAMATHVGGILGVARALADRLVAMSSVDVVFGAYQRGGKFQVQARRILPLDPALLSGSRPRPAPLHHLDPERLLLQLANEYLLAELARAIMESLASENGARLHVMENADRNIGDKLEQLQGRERALRQEAIMSEMLDVVTGSEAILGNDNSR